MIYAPGDIANKSHAHIPSEGSGIAHTHQHRSPNSPELNKLDNVETSCATWLSRASDMWTLVLKSTPVAAGDEKPEKGRWASLVPKAFLEPDLVLSKQPNGVVAGQHGMNI